MKHVRVRGVGEIAHNGGRGTVVSGAKLFKNCKNWSKMCGPYFRKTLIKSLTLYHFLQIDWLSVPPPKPLEIKAVYLFN